MNRRHMIGDHHGRTARRATMLVRAVDEILGTHILPGQPADQSLDVPPSRRPASPAAHGPGGLAAADEVPVPAQDRLRGDQKPHPVPAPSVSRRAGSPAGPDPPSSASGDADTAAAGC